MKWLAALLLAAALCLILIGFEAVVLGAFALAYLGGDVSIPVIPVVAAHAALLALLTFVVERLLFEATCILDQINPTEDT